MSPCNLLLFYQLPAIPSTDSPVRVSAVVCRRPPRLTVVADTRARYFSRPSTRLENTTSTHYYSYYLNLKTTLRNTQNWFLVDDFQIYTSMLSLTAGIVYTFTLCASVRVCEWASERVCEFVLVCVRV